MAAATAAVSTRRAARASARSAARARPTSGARLRDDRLRDDHGLLDATTHADRDRRARVGALRSVVADGVVRLRTRAVKVVRRVETEHPQTGVRERAPRVRHRHAGDVRDVYAADEVRIRPRPRLMYEARFERVQPNLCRE